MSDDSDRNVAACPASADPVVLESLRQLGSVPFRIDWFGDILYGGHRGGHSPMVNLVLSRGYEGEWIRSSGADDGTAITTAVPAAYLRLLRMGDVWVLGQRTGTDEASIQLTFPEVVVSDSTVEIVPTGLPAGQTEGEPVYLLPFAEFDAHRGHTGAFCARVRLDAGITLIVPCMELVRFYFGASGALLKLLFSGALGLDELYSNAFCHPTTGVANVTLGKGLPYQAGVTVARIAFNDRAKRAATWIAKSGVAATANKERYYPKTSFPFEGVTDLTARGRWLGTGETRAFLVEQLLECTHPFPFKALFTRSAAEVAGEAIPDGKTPVRKRSPSKRKEGRRHDRTLLEDYVSRARLPRVVATVGEFEHPFPDLVGKPIHYVRNQSRGCTTSTTELDAARELSAGEGSSSMGGRGSEVATAQSSSAKFDVEPDEVAWFRAALKALRDSGETAATFVAPISSGTADSKSPFWRADTFLPHSGERARSTWLSRIVSPRGELELLAAVVLQCDAVPDAIAMVLSCQGVKPHGDGIREICGDVAAGTIGEQQQLGVAKLAGQSDPVVALANQLRIALNT